MDVRRANFSRHPSEIDGVARRPPGPWLDLAGTILAILGVQEGTMPRTRVLIVYGTKDDSSDDLARRLARALSRAGVPAEACAADEVPDLGDYDGVALEGARQGSGWTLFARDFARRHATELKNVPAWFLPKPRGTGDGDGRDQTRWAHAIARGLGGPPATSPPIARPN